MDVLNTLLTVIYIFCSLFLGFVVLIQKGEGGGLGGLAGGGAAVDQAFGAKADMTWKRATAVAATLFMCLAIILGIISTQLHQRSSIAADSKRADQQKAAEKKTGAAKTGALAPQSASPGAKKTGE